MSDQENKIIPFKYIKSTTNKIISMREWLDEDEVLCQIMIQNLNDLKNLVYSKNTIFTDSESKDYNLCIILNFKEPDTKKNIKIYNLEKFKSVGGTIKEIYDIIHDKYEIDILTNGEVLEKYNTKDGEHTHHFYKIMY